MKAALCVALLALGTSLAMAFDEPLRVCYYTNWAQYRPVPGRFVAEDVDPTFCTHMIYAFATMEGNRLVAFEWNDESTAWSPGMYERFNNLKRINPAVKTLIAVGGWNFGTEKMTEMLATKENRTEFVSTSIDFVRQRNFDGLDLDFEWPGSRGSPPEDRGLFTLLCQELRAAVDEEARRTGRAPLILSAAVGGGKDKIDVGYDVPEVAEALDFIAIMTYDFFGAWNNYTGIHAPLYEREGMDDELEEVYNVAFAANYWAELGAPKSKLVLGVATFGRGWTLEDPNNTTVNAPAVGPSVEAPYTREAGVAAYYELCPFINSGEAVREFHPEHLAPYGWVEDQWFGYDDTESLTIKVQWLKDNGFAGWMLWTLDYDDFNGQFCGGTTNPLIKTLNRLLIGDVPSTPATVGPTLSTPLVPTGQSTPATYPTAPSTDPTGPTPTAPDAGEFCKNRENGMYANPSDCYKYIVCNNGRGQILRCALGTIYDPVLKICNFPNQVDPDYTCRVCGLC